MGQHLPSVLGSQLMAKGSMDLMVKFGKYLRTNVSPRVPHLAVTPEFQALHLIVLELNVFTVASSNFAR